MASKLQGTLSRVDGSHLVVESIGQELVVYDKKNDTAHMLDHRAAAIWRAAEGGCTMESLLPLVNAESTEQREALVQLAVTDLEQAGLLVTDAPITMPRRSLMKTLGAAAALPLVVSILAPAPAAAASNLAAAASCTVADTCAGGRTCLDATGFPASTATTGKCCVNVIGFGLNVRTAGQQCFVNEDCCSGVCSNGLTSSSPNASEAGTCTGN